MGRCLCFGKCFCLFKSLFGSKKFWIFRHRNREGPQKRDKRNRVLVRNRQNSNAKLFRKIVSNLSLSLYKKYKNFVVTSSRMSVLSKIKGNHHTHNAYSQIIAQHHSSPNTEAPFKENVDQLFSSYILLNETSRNDAL